MPLQARHRSALPDAVVEQLRQLLEHHADAPLVSTRDEGKGVRAESVRVVESLATLERSEDVR